jgi:hypothetical protein
MSPFEGAIRFELLRKDERLCRGKSLAGKRVREDSNL